MKAKVADGKIIDSMAPAEENKDFEVNGKPYKFEPTEPVEEPKVWTAKDMRTTCLVNLREKPSELGLVKDILNPNTVVKAQAPSENGWTLVKYRDTTGYIKSEFLK